MHAPTRAGPAIATTCGVVVAGIAVAALVGFRLDVDVLLRWAPSSERIRPPAAALLALSGAALALFASPAPGARVVARIAAAVVGTGGTCIVVGYALGAWTSATTRPSWTGSVLGVAFVAGVLLLDRSRARRVADACAAFVVAGALVAVVGYAFGAPPLYGVASLAPETALSLPAAVGFALLGVGLIVVRPGAGLAAIVMSDGAGGVLVRRAIWVVPLVPVVGVAARAGEAAGWYGEPATFAATAAAVLLCGGAVVLRAARDLERVDGARAAAAAETARAYDAEAKQRAWLSAVLDQMPEGAVIIDAEGHIQLENHASRTMHGPVQEGVDPFGNAERFDVRTRDDVPVPFDRWPIVRALRTGERVPVEELAVRVPDGRLVPIECAAAPVVVNGASVGAVVVFHDVTKRKELERQRDEWISVVAHDLRQPATAIALEAGAAERALDATTSPAVAEAMRRMRASAKRLNRMIDDLLDVSRMDAERLEVDVARVDLAALVGAAVERARPALRDRRVEVAVDGPVYVAADADRVEQVLGNLLSNAAKYGADGRPIAVRVATREAAAVVAVTNEGGGIAPDELPHLFARFRRTRDAEDSGERGVGLGLFICKGLVEAQGGTIDVQSTPGARTTFSFTLPLAS